MKKLILIFIGVIFCLIGFGQKITQLPVSTSTVGGSLLMVRSGASGNVLSQITKTNLLSDAADYIVDSLSASTVIPFYSDTIPLVTFGAGAGLTADTALFNNGVLIGCFYNEGSDTLVITQMACILKDGPGNETIAVQISWHATMLSGSATDLNAAAYTVTSITTGDIDVAFANPKIPPNVFVWGILSGASSGNKPTFLSVTLSGYKIPVY